MVVAASIYVEHCLIPLFTTAAVAGLWSGIRVIVSNSNVWRQKNENQHVLVPWKGWNAQSPLRWLDAIRLRRLAGAARSISSVPCRCIHSRGGSIVLLLARPRPHRSLFRPLPMTGIAQFLDNKIGTRVDSRFRGSAFFYTFALDEFLTLDSLWADGVPTTNEYGQLVTPQAIYFIHQLFSRDLSSDLNWFRPWINTGGAAFPVLFRTFRALGVRYVGGYEQLEVAGMEGFRSASFPRRPPGNPPGLWVLDEIPDVNVGDYSPTEVTTARSAAEIVAALGAANFDLTRQAVLSAEVRDPLVPARDMKLSVIRGGLMFRGTATAHHSSCYRSNSRIACALVTETFALCAPTSLYRSDPSDDVDTDIVFDYGIFTPGLSVVRSRGYQETEDADRCECGAVIGLEALLTGRKQFRSSAPPCDGPDQSSHPSVLVASPGRW